jgi:hypothetical protein
MAQAEKRAEVSTAFPILIDVDDETRALFLDRERVDGWEGGMPELIRHMRDRWVEWGSGDVMPVDDYRTYRRIQHYANDYGEGTWQRHIKRWARHLPGNVQDPQGALF